MAQAKGNSIATAAELMQNQTAEDSVVHQTAEVVEAGVVQALVVDLPTMVVCGALAAHQTAASAASGTGDRVAGLRRMLGQRVLEQVV